jgi:hypothetical protein
VQWRRPPTVQPVPYPQAPQSYALPPAPPPPVAPPGNSDDSVIAE